MSVYGIPIKSDVTIRFLKEVAMRPDRYTKVVLTIIAICLSVLTLSEIGLPELTTRAEAMVPVRPALPSQTAEEPGNDSVPARASTATLPLRWRIPWATELAASTTNCGTAVVVVNDTNKNLWVEVEWFDLTGSSQALRFLSIPGFEQRTWISGGVPLNGDTDTKPFYNANKAEISDLLGGYARVHAEDPRIEVAAFQYCRDAQGYDKNLLSITNLPAYPVGATLEYFQAGMPTTWMPPMAVPELPE